MPAATPVATPLDEPTVATALLLLVHVPPGVALLRLLFTPIHKLGLPEIAVNVLTFTVDVVE